MWSITWLRGNTDRSHACCLYMVFQKISFSRDATETEGLNSINNAI